MHRNCFNAMSSTPHTKRRPPDLGDGLPVNEEAERFVLGLVLLRAEKYLALARAELVPDDFLLDKHRRIFQRILKLDTRGAKVDYVTVAEELNRHGELESCGSLNPYQPHNRPAAILKCK